MCAYFGREFIVAGWLGGWEWGISSSRFLFRSFQYLKWAPNHNWLLGWTPLKNDGLRQLGWWLDIPNMNRKMYKNGNQFPPTRQVIIALLYSLGWIRTVGILHLGVLGYLCANDHIFHSPENFFMLGGRYPCEAPFQWGRCLNYPDSDVHYLRLIFPVKPSFNSRGVSWNDTDLIYGCV